MDPCSFLRIVIGNLGLRFPAGSPYKENAGLYHCKIKLKGLPAQVSAIPVISRDSNSIEARINACYSFSKSDFLKFVEKNQSKGRSLTTMSVKIYKGIRGTANSCGWKSEKLFGQVRVPVDLRAVESNIGSSKSFVIENGWVTVEGGDSPELHMNVRVDRDPRFVFEFDAEPECSPQVFQVNGNRKQPVFTCKFGFRNSGERNLRSRSCLQDSNTKVGCFSPPTGKEQSANERKGWSITIHDLSGSPVAAASMVTPFVASPGSNRVKRSNPGAWLILRPGNGTWRPWGKLEAWRERDHGDQLGYRFELVPDGSIDTVILANSTVSTKKGGKFSIDIATGATPLVSPNSSFDLSSGSISGSEPGSASGSISWVNLLYRGFVMSSTVKGEGKNSFKPVVEVGMQHVACTEDAAAFVALAAAMHLTVDACRLFTGKLRKELRQPEEE